MFQDGSSFGDPQWAQRIRDRRAFYLASVERAILALEQPMLPDYTREQIVQQFQSAKASQVAGITNRDQVEVITGINNMIIHNFRDVQKNPDGTAITVAGMVEGLLKELNVRRDVLNRCGNN